MAEEKNKKFKIVPYRYLDKNRIYSNYIEVAKTGTDLSIKFCDIRPPENKEEVNEVKKTGEIRVPIEAEMIIPLPVAADFLRALRLQIADKENNQ